ncbi:MAG: hypothetical protein Hyperionvirus4_50 [Hyperionvirus sp.]|uniref:Uncharacterized protein n=1 Tax=Hyperionvirus sp. TaxID=2487770 RepID=A0A3G5A777_9VIRU|nr:MAG: hypothetical protein Hyperionvirus4_50 [Hyperionvirus sp.]
MNQNMAAPGDRREQPLREGVDALASGDLSGSNATMNSKVKLPKLSSISYNLLPATLPVSE